MPQLFVVDPARIDKMRTVTKSIGEGRPPRWVMHRASPRERVIINAAYRTIGPHCHAWGCREIALMIQRSNGAASRMVRRMRLTLLARPVVVMLHVGEGVDERILDLVFHRLIVRTGMREVAAVMRVSREQQMVLLAMIECWALAGDTRSTIHAAMVARLDAWSAGPHRRANEREKAKGGAAAHGVQHVRRCDGTPGGVAAPRDAGEAAVLA